MHVTFDLAIPICGMYPTTILAYVWNDVLTMFIATLWMIEKQLEMINNEENGLLTAMKKWGSVLCDTYYGATKIIYHIVICKKARCNKVHLI